MTTADTYLDDTADYTDGCKARLHLGGLIVQFADPDSITAPDPDICQAGTYPLAYVSLLARWQKCQQAASIINERFTEDMQRGGVLTVIAPSVRAAALCELAAVWESLIETYLSETIEQNRRREDCPFCGVAVPRTIDGRCPECMAVLNQAEDGSWT